MREAEWTVGGVGDDRMNRDWLENRIGDLLTELRDPRTTLADARVIQSQLDTAREWLGRLPVE